MSFGAGGHASLGQILAGLSDGLTNFFFSSPPWLIDTQHSDHTRSAAKRSSAKQCTE